MNKITETIFKLQGQARRLLEVTNKAIEGLAVGEYLKSINSDTAYAVNRIAEDIGRLTLDAIPLPRTKGTCPTAELLQHLKEARECHTKRLHATPLQLEIIQDLTLSQDALINAACVLAKLTADVTDNRIQTDTPVDRLTDTEIYTLNIIMQEIMKTGKPFARLIEGKD